MSSNAPNNEGVGGFAAMKSIFGRGSFPGTIRLSRHSRGDSQQDPPAAGSEASLANAQQGISSMSLSNNPNHQTTEASSSSYGGASSTPHKDSRPSSPEASTPHKDSTSLPASPSTTTTTTTVTALRSMSEAKVAKFTKVLDESVVDLEALKELAWTGIPAHMRPDCWRLLLGYLPPNKERRDQILARKRKEYRDLVPDYYDMSAMLRSADEENALRQVAVDVPRTAPGVPFFHQPPVQKSLERILYIWGVRHPASGYVQGINDLVTPFLAVFASEHMQDGSMDVWSMETLEENTLLDVEADCYWCLCKFLDGIQDHYTYAQPGIQRTLFRVKELVGRVDAPVAAHVEKEGLEFMQFAFRWVNCLLLRELPFSLGVRLWDTYLAEGTAIKEFLVYVLSSFLLGWGPELKTMEFQDLIMFLQKPPTGGWCEKDIELVLSRAYMWRMSFKDATSHFSN